MGVKTSAKPFNFGYNGNLLKGIVAKTILTKIVAPTVVRFIITVGGMLDLDSDLNRINQWIKLTHRSDFSILNNIPCGHDTALVTGSIKSKIYS